MGSISGLVINKAFNIPLVIKMKLIDGKERCRVWSNKYADL